jgi:predicted lipoprotein
MSKRFLAPGAFGLALALAAPLLLPMVQPAAAAVKAADVIGAAIDGFIRPAYASLHDRAKGLTKAMQALCAAPSPANLDAARRPMPISPGRRSTGVRK